MDKLQTRPSGIQTEYGAEFDEHGYVALLVEEDRKSDAKYGVEKESLFGRGQVASLTDLFEDLSRQSGHEETNTGSNDGVLEGLDQGHATAGVWRLEHFDDAHKERCGERAERGGDFWC